MVAFSTLQRDFADLDTVALLPDRPIDPKVDPSIPTSRRPARQRQRRAHPRVRGFEDDLAEPAIVGAHLHGDLRMRRRAWNCARSGSIMAVALLGTKNVAWPLVHRYRIHD